MTQGQAVTILLSVGPLIHRTLNDGVMDILEPRCQPIVFSAIAVSPRQRYGLFRCPLRFTTLLTTSKLTTIPEKAYKNSSKAPTAGPRSVQSGFTHRLRDGKNHIYLW
jgi:hypothetical protein